MVAAKERPCIASNVGTRSMILSTSSGAYKAASREKTSGQNENDVLKLAHQIFYTNHKKKFLPKHAWKELRNDKKWYEASSAKNEGSSKKKKV